MTFYERREQIKQILKRKGRVSCGELAKKFGVSKNTIVRDIDALTATFQVSTTLGRFGGYSYQGDGTSDFNARQTKYLYEYMRTHATEAADDTFVEILEILEHAMVKPSEKK